MRMHYEKCKVWNVRFIRKLVSFLLIKNIDVLNVVENVKDELTSIWVYDLHCDFIVRGA